MTLGRRKFPADRKGNPLAKREPSRASTASKAFDSLKDASPLKALHSLKGFLSFSSHLTSRTVTFEPHQFISGASLPMVCSSHVTHVRVTYRRTLIFSTLFLLTFFFFFFVKRINWIRLWKSTPLRLMNFFFFFFRLQKILASIEVGFEAIESRWKKIKWPTKARNR